MHGDLTTRRSATFFVALGCIQVIWPLTMDLYLAAFPVIQDGLRANPAAVQFTLTGAFIGMAAGQLITGPLSDRMGRMRPLAVALVVFCVATFGCAVAPNVSALIGFRALQGFGAAGAAVINLAIVRDVTSGSRMVALLARLQLVNGVFVVGAPAMGAQLLPLTGWRGLFWVLLGYGVALLVVTVAVLLRSETLAATRGRDRAALRSDYRLLVGDPQYRSVVIGGALLWAGMMSYMAASSFLFQEVFGLSATAYAIVFGGHGALMVVGAQVSSRVAVTVDLGRLVRYGTAVVLTAAVGLLISVVAFPGWGFVGFLVPLLVFTTGFGMVSPTIQSVALLRHGDRAGTAASLLGASNMVSAAAAAPLAGLMGLDTALPAACFVAGGALLGSVFLIVGTRSAAAQTSAAAPERASRR
ncbi:MFS transporter [Nakamurella deserti]|uniref:MFS transporter n=1 Tax=Nakamurella deserti TaxID=2164074 RepID=UPI000DBE56E4|nr:MFS transporter [Nakamurella deserti]